MGVPEGGGVFISYRRAESRHVAGRLADRLIDRFGAERVFIDVEAIEPGVDWAEAISRAVDACVVLVAVIGPGWLSAADNRGRRRLDDPHDFVRLEVEAALARGIKVIPVLVEGAVIPDRRDLPEGLTGLVRLQALHIQHESFRYDAERLSEAIEQALAAAPAVGGAALGAPSAVIESAEAVKQDPKPRRTDLAWAARLLDDAERIANSITDESAKAQALCRIAETVSVTDPGRTSRLVADVERTAGYLGIHSKPQALCEIAVAVAVIDPDRAERIANSITDDYYKATYKDYALGEVAGAVAAIDPSRAERIANSISYEPVKAQALSAVAAAVAATDPAWATRLTGYAERTAELTADEYWKARVLSATAKAVAVTDPDRGERIANSITHKLTKPYALGGVAAAVALTDPDRAERIANSIDRPARAQALSSVAAVVAATDPDRAERIANSINDQLTMPRALSSVAAVVAATDPERAERIANSIESVLGQPAKAQALSSVAAAVAVTDPDRAERIANNINDKTAKAVALSGIAKALAT